jgi:GTP-binding protein LepA
LITTAPSVVYRVIRLMAAELHIDNPALFPGRGPRSDRRTLCAGSIMTPEEFVGPVMEICQERRGTFVNMEYVTTDRVQLTYEMPLSEIIMDFFDRLKSRTKGYASLDYESIGYREAKPGETRCSLNGNPVDACPVLSIGIQQLIEGRDSWPKS